MDFARSVSVALDPVLVPLGFTAGQRGDTQAIYCGGHDELSDRFPGLPQSNAQDRGLGCCIDLTVNLEDHGVSVDLEAYSLAETLEAVGLQEDANASAALANAPLDEALERLTDILPRLFQATSA